MHKPNITTLLFLCVWPSTYLVLPSSSIMCHYAFLNIQSPSILQLCFTDISCILWHLFISQNPTYVQAHIILCGLLQLPQCSHYSLFCLSHHCPQTIVQVIILQNKCGHVILLSWDLHCLITAYKIYIIVNEALHNLVNSYSSSFVFCRSFFSLCH